MAEMKISDMIEAENVNDEDLIMIVQNGVNKKVAASKVGAGVVFYWDGQSSSDNSDNIDLFQEIYETQLVKDCVIITKPTHVQGYVFTIPRNSLNSTNITQNIYGMAYYHGNSTSGGVTATTFYRYRTYVVFSNGAISYVGTMIEDTKTFNYLDTITNYSSTYIPMYDGSPATKKYVHDRITRTVVTAYPTAQSTNITSEDQVVTLDGSCTAGTNKLVVENNAIKVGSTVSRVLISAQIFYQDHTGATSLIPNVKINGNKVARSIMVNSNLGNYETVQISPFMASVSQGDLITLTVGKRDGATGGSYRGEISGSGIHTYITVEVIG